MKKRNNEFNDRIKANINSIAPKNPISKREEYTCLKLMQDSSNIYYFLKNSLPSTFSSSKAFSYYYSISTELEIINLDLREGDINMNEFENQFNKICDKYQIDFNSLLNISSEVDLLKKQSDHQKQMELCNKLEKSASEYFESRENSRDD